MLSQLPEQRMHWIRWILTVGWLLIIASLFYDPWTAKLTTPDHPWSPLRLSESCIQVQGNCLSEQPYPLGTTLFWGAIVPASIFILLVFGHELWRRICPLSFLSQIPRSLGWQRQFRRENKKTGKVRYELAKVRSDSWLGRNYPYVQFSWLFIGLCGRILFFNADRLVLAGWLLSTVAAAIAVGYWYGGKSWCQYFCPMAPVQSIYSEPGGLLGSKAHTSEQLITQSMCRTFLPDGQEQSACVACQNPCIDIDAERNYWNSLSKPETGFIRYGYVGLVIGYFGYYYLYAGNWNYYFSGAWLRQTDQLTSLFDPGIYLFGQAINVPKIIAVPLILGICTAIAYGGGRWLEKRAKSYYRRHPKELSLETIRHRIFTLCTFGIFNFFFIFGGRPLIQLFPWAVQYLYDLGLVTLSTLWLYKTWRRSPDLYSRENLANRFRKQLEKLQLNVSQFLEGRTLNDLNTHEVYILAKVLPGFTREKRHQAYKGVVREALEEGYINYSSSLEVLQQMRQELGITDDEHRIVLEEVGIEDPSLLNPDRQRSLENQIRLSGYRKSLERLLLLQSKQVAQGSLDPGSLQDSATIRSLRRQYSITSQDEEWILSGLAGNASSVKRAEFLLAQLSQLIDCYRVLNQPVLYDHKAVLTLLRENISHKKELIVRSILETLELLQSDPAALGLAQRLQQASPAILGEVLDQGHWSDRLPAAILQCLTQPGEMPVFCSLEFSAQATLGHLETLLLDQNPMIQAAALYVIAQLDPERSQAIARDQRHPFNSPLVKATLEQLLALPSNASAHPSLTDFPMLERVVYLFNSDFFHRMQSETLIALADRAEVRTYSKGDLITEAGDTCRELLLLIEGHANVHYQTGAEVRIEQLHPGQTLDELEVLAHSKSENTIVADSERTRILAISVDAFDDFLDHDPDFARRVLELESRQLQRFVRSMQSI
ncbi:cyclic nucleotide-binding domain-containing protein [Synechococcus elongatus]|uniref:Cyclic nucleotide-binding domain (cNMP-BD) protein n=1 Tax=Synechococcus elongatus (strain ATCC 33912 / PCC 7942 / FACHB-805) TaxID=1140 RepID=Q31S06_SYNE7|nr:cyclic nucleotide-binding domain-containing protein [Synechococcus elongatus]ABB56163.1 cyclic nucleotide-binding domain (cNMP-BD) protein [Synechococcus elongatus PCC 7942 = FACHB-805]AJD56784.1 cyclic nucleotide-binding protein [Synechococcus elongatus UTEX 2973]MBD2587995.1 cyclic nucleotide-binding domain-containing protein [Synechococcus elongatus FACHB-242]MBD2689063.1 cyclic nucleotide-binding domain-containing protein [Synechococcus elongatus FACHB-1061]MBD2707297.1 cyclic nucleotid